MQGNAKVDAVPEKLKASVNMILEGPNIKDQTENDDKSVGLTKWGEITGGSSYEKQGDTIPHLP